MSYPYANTTPGLMAVIRQLRSAFPAVVTADTLKKWSIAPNNESYIIGVLRFLGLIDEKGKKNNDAGVAFLMHENVEFQEAFATQVKNAYAGLFDTFGDEAWILDKGRLVGYFRRSDGTSAILGQRQAMTFEVLAQQVGKRPSERRRETAAGRDPAPMKRAVKAKESIERRPASHSKQPARESEAVALTVRVEINLPIADDQEVYNRIFKSIRENFLPQERS